MAATGAGSKEGAVLDAIDAGVIVLDGGARVVGWNRWMSRFSGLPSSEVLGRSLTEIFPQTAGKRLDAAVAMALSHRLASLISPTIHAPILPLHSDPAKRTRGRYIQQLVNVSPLGGGMKAGGAAPAHAGDSGCMIQIQDMSAAMERERLLREQSDQLKRVNQALQASQARAEEGSRAKGEFLANMSHEIRTPMNGILGMLQLMKMTELSAEQSNYVQHAKTATESLLGILNDILDLSKVEAGQLSLENARFSLDELLEGIAAISSASVKDKDIDMLFSVADDVPSYLIGDALRLKQILLNLLGNAIKFTSAGEVMLEVRALSSTVVDAGEAERFTLEFSVQDSGIGIARDKLESIFEAFSQADGSITRRYGGTGLGLTISRRLVAAMGGELCVESEVGVGSRFYFALSLTGQRDRSGDDAGSLSAGTAKPLTTALIVGGKPRSRAILVRHLRSFGGEALELMTVEDLLTHLEHSGAGVDLVFLDHGILNGAELPALISPALPSGKRPRLIVVARQSPDLSERRRDWERAGFDGIVVKPTTRRRIELAIRAS